MCDAVAKTIKNRPHRATASVVVIMEEMIVLPKKEVPEVVQWYKGELMGNALLNRAGHLAAKKKRILADPDLDAAEVVQQTRPLSRALREATKRLRYMPGSGEGQGRTALDDDEEDENLVTTALEKWMKRMVQSGLKREPVTPRPPQPVTPRTAFKRPPSTATLPPKKTKTPRTQSPEGSTSRTVPSQQKKKKKKGFWRGMLDESLSAGYKSVKPTPPARRRLDPAPGWEDWADGRKLRRKLDGHDY